MSSEHSVRVGWTYLVLSMTAEDLIGLKLPKQELVAEDLHRPIIEFDNLFKI